MCEIILNLDFGKESIVCDKIRGDCVYLKRLNERSALGEWSPIQLKVADIEIVVDDDGSVVIRKGDILETDG